MRFELRSNGDVVVRSLEGVADLAADPRELLEDMGEHMVNVSVPETFRQGGRPHRWPSSKWQTGERPMQDSNRLLRSVRHEVGGKVLRVGSNARYARQRQLGGTIRPVKAKALAFPIPGAVPNTMRRPGAWGDRLFVLPNKDGDPDKVGVLATRDDKDGSVTARFLLRRQVTQPARPFVVFTDDDIAWFSRRIAQRMQEAR